MPELLNLARYDLIEETPESAEELFSRLEKVLGAVSGAEHATLWRRVTGEPLMAMTSWTSVEKLLEFEKHFVMSNAFEKVRDQIEFAPDVDRVEIVIHRGASPLDVPIGGYCSVNAIVADPGMVSDELTEAGYILDSMWQIEGFLGAYVGKSLIVQGQLISVAFWSDNDAAQRAIPIRVETNLQLYRRIH